MNQPLSLVLAGGGTAGHVNPLLAVAAELRRRYPSARLTALGTATGVEAELVPAAGLDLRYIPRVPLPRRPSADLVTLPTRFNAAVKDVARIIQEVGAQGIVGFGGYVATPAYLAARKLRLPLIIHEQNTRPGLANRVGARWASVVATTFAHTPLPGAQQVGLPLRAPIEELAAANAAGRGRAARWAAAAAVGIDPELATLLVTGGSLGAQSINEAVAGSVHRLVREGQVVHVTGRGKTEAALRARSMLDAALRDRYVVIEYAHNMDQLFALADMVLTRAGAGMVCELAALGLPAVYVPLPIGNGEQARNAHDVVAAGGGVLVNDADLTASWLEDNAIPLWQSPDRLANMRTAARSVGALDATKTLTDLIVKAIVRQ
ncbi:undecaprenyldiphospho-muramoylpentapeptide beta-N-acetylglucosaminyltransferase [Rarobacter incanus]|uniref:UDP-N-acetylglucosamine--N-acetylmuramyl-(pentapeptide) pyrophosphoryl-undecaprenol N-acetylglucosamine transferase n=1 Tax=Rarobacter incanus TaxID=153494 RepID=A0A542SML8_9MICO|nr:undecaprenyldiphospho-muramoylpentapeptide beta-N-acetylglucosaminyltransferase [Rarobacter incanus]TQK75497.1 UDP-N-acetylglucosamine-N-acetylmuramylpentapeptide N-acetylglucosamine transferase [Rarobacter incanus]